MADSLQFAEFTKKNLSIRGVEEVLKSQGVVSLVTEHAERITASANATAEGRRGEMDPNVANLLAKRDEDAFREPPYEMKVKKGRHTTLGVVRSATIEGAYDSNQNQTLDSLNH